MERPVLIDFFSEWCAPCTEQTAIVQDLAARLGDRVEVRMVDVAERRDLISAYRLVTVPTIIIEVNGKVVKRFEKVTDGETLESILLSLIDDHAHRGIV